MAALLGGLVAAAAVQTPAVRTLDETLLRQYAGVYQWEAGAFLDLQPWTEIVPQIHLVAFDESGEVRALFPTDRDRFLYTLTVLPQANHGMLEATIGSHAEMPSLQRFVREYFTTVHEWVARRVRGYPKPGR